MKFILKPKNFALLFGVIAVTAIMVRFTNSTKNTVVKKESPFLYSMKIADKKIRSYRSPASVQKEADDETKKPVEMKRSRSASPKKKSHKYKSRRINHNPSTYEYANRVPFIPSPKTVPEATEAPEKKQQEARKVIALGGSLPLPENPQILEPSDSSNKKNASDEKPFLAGRVKPLEGLVARNQFGLINSAYAATVCTDPHILLLDLQNMSILLDNPVSQDVIESSTQFSFDPVHLKLDISTPTRYMLQTTGCDVNYQRIISSFYDDQNLDQITTLISKVVNTPISGVLNSIQASDIDNLYNLVLNHAQVAPDIEDVYAIIDSQPTLKATFQSTFQGGVIDELPNAAPDISEVTYFTDVNEKQTYSYHVNASHWSTAYVIAYEWQVDGITVATTPGFNWTPEANSRSVRKITMIVGRDDGNGMGLVDRSLAYHEVEFDLTISDTFPTSAPAMTLAAASNNPSATKSIVLDITTGTQADGVFSGCETFSAFAITEDNTPPVDGDFTRSCTAGPNQLENYTIQKATDGQVTVNVWSKDSEGRISLIPSTYLIDVDTTAPIIDFISMEPGYVADEDHTFVWSLTEANSSSTQSFTIHFTTDGGTTWSPLPSEPLTNGPHNGAVFSTSYHVPNVNTSNAKLRVTYADTLGQQTIAETAAFKIMRPVLGSSPLSLDMGSVLNKAESGSFSFNFTNTGEVTTKLCGLVTLGGTHSSEFTITADGCNGTTLAASTGSCTVSVKATPAAEGTRNASATLTCGSDTYTTPITINSLNNAPTVATATVRTTSEDTSFTFSMGPVNDIDPDALTYTLVTPPAKGTISGCADVSGNWTCTYSPDLNYNGSDSFTFKSNDGTADSNTGTFNVTINAINDAPSLSGPQSIATNEDTAVTFDLTAGVDIENSTLTYIKLSDPSNGTISCAGGTSRTCTYTPSADFTGSDSFTYKVNDGSLDSNTNTVNLTVNPVNDPPVVAINQTFTTNEDTPYNFTILDASDIDVPAQTLSYQVVTAPANGTLSNCIATGLYGADLSCTYTPSSNFNGTDNFTYKAYDGITDSTTVATITLNVTAVNDAPVVAATQSVTTAEDTALSFTLNAGTDVDNATLYYNVVSGPASGSLTCTGGTSTNCSYSPALNFTGNVTFTYEVSDGTLTSSLATVTITVSGENDAPVVAANQSLSTNEDTALNFTISNATDVDGDPLGYKIISSPSKGTLSNCITTTAYGTDLTCTYTPGANATGTDSFTYRANDGSADSATVATITINIIPVNDAPTLAATQAISTNEDTAVTFDLSAGADIEGNSLTYIKLTDTTNGTISCTGGTSRSCTYTPSLNFNGSDSFTYKVNDGSADSTSATVTVTVNPVNDPPVVAADQTIAATEDTALAITIDPGSDIDLPAQTLSYILITPPAKGTLTNCISTGSYSTDRVCDYTPAADATGADSFTYKVYDSLLESVSTATVTINISAVNDAPTLAASQSVSTPEDTPLTFLLTAGADTENDPLTYLKITDTTNGTISCTGGSSRSCTYTPDTNFNGTDSFTYKVNDGTADSTSATVTITVTPVNDPPVMAANQSYATNDNTALAISLSPATDIDGGALTYKIVSAPTHGTLGGCITTAGYGTDLTCSYTSDTNYHGTDSFTFVAHDTFTDAVTVATVTITVSDTTPSPAPLIALTSPQFTKVTGLTFTASSCTDTPSLFVNEGTQPASGAVGWQSCTTTANAITSSLGATPAQGLHTVKVWSKDVYGNVSSTSTDFSVYYDTVVPAMSLSLPSTLKGGATYSLAWTATESYTSTSLNFTVEAFNGTTWSTVGTTASTDGPLSSTAFTRSWTVPVVNTSSAQFRVSFTDRAGNSNTVTSGTFAIDSTAPVLTITSPAASSYHKSSATITGACEVGRDITFSGGIQTTFSIACTTGTYSQLVNFSDGDGTKAITVSQTDAVGNITNVSINLIRDEVAPILAKTSGASPDFTRFNTPNAWAGTCEGNYTISVTGSETTSFACSSGSWSWTPTAKTTDGVYSYDLVQTDAAGNTSTPPLTLSWERDATAPTFSIATPFTASSGGTANITNNLNSISLSGNCEGTNAISISGAATQIISCSSSSWTWTTPTVSTDGLRTYTFTQTDSAGNTSTITLNWTRDTTGPALTIATAIKKSNTDTVNFSGNCEPGVTIQITGTETTSVSCPAGTWTFTTVSNLTDATRNYTFTQTFTVTPFNSTAVTGKWIRETNAPVVTNFTSSAANPSNSSFIPVDLSASSQNAEVYLSHLCFKSDDSTKPLASDGCFIGVNSPAIGQALGQNLSLNEFNTLLGWTPKTYNLYIWVMDEAGNISNLTSSGAGTIGVDRINHSYDPGIPPTISDVIAANADTTAIPPTRAQGEVPAGSDVYIRWKVSDNITLPAGAITLYYTSDEINFNEITAGINAHSNSGCPNIVLAPNEGCYAWIGGSPLNTAYKIRVKVTDAGGISTQLISNPLNSGLLKIIAGNTESGLGGSAQTAMFYTRRSGSYADNGSLVVTNDGKFFFADWKRGILTIDQADGKQKVFIPATGSSSGDGGPAANATLKYATKLALDYQNRLLILDRDRIRRVNLNLSTPTIETIIGGGINEADTVANPLDVKIYPHSDNSWLVAGSAFFALPNGDIYFHSDYSFKEYNNPSYRIRIYQAATGQVISKYFTGTGDSFVPTQDLSLCRMSGPGFKFNPATSALTGVTTMTWHDPSFPGCDQAARHAKAFFDPITFEAIPAPDDSYRYYVYFNFTGMDGENYIAVSRNYIMKMNFDGTYTRVLGQGTNGECPDGTLATSCMIDIQNLFVTTTGKMYFTDRGVIRTVENDGTVKTLFGQKLTYGHNVNALNARMSEVSYVARLDNGKIITNDIGGNYIKEFTIEGNINIIAGDGATRNASLATPAVSYSLIDTRWIGVDKANGEVYASYLNSAMGTYLKLNRSTGYWEQILGSGTGVNYTTADGEVGLNVLGTSSDYTNRGLIMGFQNNRLVLARMSHNTAAQAYEHFMIKTYDSTDSYRQEHIGGVLGNPGVPRATCDATSPVTAATCAMPYWDTFQDFQWDAVNGRWITAVANGGTQKDIYEIYPGGNIQKIGTTATNIDDSFLYLNQSGTDYFYYCNSGRIKKYNLTTKTDLGALPWSMTNLSCRGNKMDYNPVNNTIIFPFEQNGLFGVAEYAL